MKLTLISMVFPHPRPGIWPGIERHVGELSRALVNLGNEVRVLTSFWNGGQARETWDGVEIHRIPDARQKWGKAAFLFNWNVRAFSRNVWNEPELLRSADAIHTFVGLNGIDKLSGIGVPLFASFPHRDKAERLQDSIVQLGRFSTEKAFFRRARAVFAGSAAARTVLVNQYQLDPSRVHVVPLAVDSGLFRPPEAPRPADPSKDRPEGLKLLYAGPLIPRKSLGTLIESLPQLESASVPYELTIVGRGPDRYSLRDLAARLGVLGRIRFKGFLEESELVRHYQQADLFVFPSIREGFGLVLVEAMACGLPCVTTDVQPMPEVVGDAGLVFPASDPAAMARAIIKFARDGKLRKSLAEAGLRRVRDVYSWSRVARQTMEHYEGALTNGGGR